MMNFGRKPRVGAYDACFDSWTQMALLIFVLQLKIYLYHTTPCHYEFQVSPEVKDWIHRISIVWWRKNTPFWTPIPGQSSRIWSQETRGWNRYRYSRCPCWKSLKNLAVCQTLPLMLMLVHLDSKYIAGLSPSISLSMCTWNQILFFIPSTKFRDKVKNKGQIWAGRFGLSVVGSEKFWVVCFSARHLRSGSWKKPNPTWPAGYDEQGRLSRLVMF